MVAPAVVSVIVTLCAEVYVPVPGEITGIAAGGVMVITDVATALLVKLLPPAMALTVVVEFTVNELV
jgi:hypothetical protein